MYKSEPDVLSQYELLSKAVEEVFNIKNDELEGNLIYIELKKVRTQLAEMEKSFPQPSKKKSFADATIFAQSAPVTMLGLV